MIVDFDDFCESDNRLDLLQELRYANPLFRCTLFAIPTLGSRRFWASVPEWCELAIHGWQHPHPRECEHWTWSEAQAVFGRADMRFTCGFKAPGWQISDATYAVALEFDYWIADHWDNDHRRPDGLLCHVIQPDYRTNRDHWHGHIPNVCGNGIEETFPELLQRVKEADSFQWVSEAVTPWRVPVAA